jgi:hypothetical protein
MRKQASEFLRGSHYYGCHSVHFDLRGGAIALRADVFVLDDPEFLGGHQQFHASRDDFRRGANHFLSANAESYYGDGQSRSRG